MDHYNQKLFDQRKMKLKLMRSFMKTRNIHLVNQVKNRWQN